LPWIPAKSAYSILRRAIASHDNRRSRGHWRHGDRHAQRRVANAYGFKSWRTLKAHIETLNSSLRERDCVFDAARAGLSRRSAVLGWATSLCGGRRSICSSAIALDKGDVVRAMLARDPGLLHARMTRNQHRGTALHHAAAKGRLRMVQLLLELGADPNTTDATGATVLTTASQENADPTVVAALLAAGAKLDFLTALNTGRHAEAEVMVREDPARIGPDGRDTIALHLAVNKRSRGAIRWLLANGFDVNAKRPMWDCNHAVLHMTVESGALDIARLLLDHGADRNVRDDKYKATALGWADFFGRADFVKLITEKGGVT
jgi:hypothetical protein